MSSFSFFHDNEPKYISEWRMIFDLPSRGSKNARSAGSIGLSTDSTEEGKKQNNHRKKEVPFPMHKVIYCEKG